jgi:hypothetical protein
MVDIPSDLNTVKNLLIPIYRPKQQGRRKFKNKKLPRH